MRESSYDREHAELYDLAFSWDIEAEVDWILERLGARTGAALLEPFCGNGRHLPFFARRGVDVVGVDRSADMLALATRRVTSAGLPAPRLVQADARELDLGRVFDGAYCPTNSLGHVHGHDDLVRHFTRVARHLRPGGRYLVQLGLRDTTDLRPIVADAVSEWDVDTPHGCLRTTWTSGKFDAATNVEAQTCRFEWRTGARAGRVVEFPHAIRIWDWESWSAALASSPFRQVGAWDGQFAARPALAVGAGMQGRLLAWHELALA